MAEVLHINKLQNFQKEWKIKVKVLQILPIQKYNNSKGSGEIQKLILVDDEAILFNDEIHKFANTLEKEKTHYITDGMIRNANSDFPTVHKDYEIFLNNISKIEETDDIIKVQAIKHNFTNLKELQNMPTRSATTYDILGIVTRVEDAIPFISVRTRIKACDEQYKSLI